MVSHGVCSSQKVTSLLDKTKHRRCLNYFYDIFMVLFGHFGASFNFITWKRGAKNQFCSIEESKSFRFETTQGCVDDDRIFIFMWIVSLNDHNRYLCKIAKIIAINGSFFPPHLSPRNKNKKSNWNFSNNSDFFLIITSFYFGIQTL